MAVKMCKFVDLGKVGKGGKDECIRFSPILMHLLWVDLI